MNLPSKPLCIVCSLAPERAHWRCGTCLRFFTRHGHDRPAHLLDRALERQMVKR